MISLLSGIRVIDLTRMLAGPYCTLLLADMGAEIIKIEEPEKGDGIRRMGPPFLSGESAYFISINRNKRSMTLDLKSPEGRELLLKLVETADVVVENFRPGVMARLSLDYETLKQANRSIICCSISGFGQTGPYRERPAYDLVLQAISGVVSLTGEPGRTPVRCGIPVGDIAGALMAAFAISGALVKRGKTGEGAYIDIGLMDSLVFMAPYMAQYYFADGKIPGTSGSEHRSVVPYRIYETRDDTIVVAVFGENFWKAFCLAIEQSDLAADPRFEINEKRVANREVLEPILEKALKTRDTQQWLKIFEQYGVPACEVKTIDRVLEDEQVKARGMIVSMEHPACGTVPTLANPVRVSGETAEIRHAPLLGEHTNEILSGILGMTPPEINDLHTRKIV